MADGDNTLSGPAFTLFSVGNGNPVKVFNDEDISSGRIRAERNAKSLQKQIFI